MAIVGAMVESAGLGRNRSLNDVIVSWNYIMTDPVREMAYAPLYNKNGNLVQEAAVSARSVQGGGRANSKPFYVVETEYAALEPWNRQVPRDDILAEYYGHLVPTE